jgi:hypothetical protein
MRAVVTTGLPLRVTTSAAWTTMAIGTLPATPEIVRLKLLPAAMAYGPEPP